MNRRELYNFMVRSLSGSPGGCEEPTQEIMDEAGIENIVPWGLLPEGNWVEDTAYMDKHELDGMSWPDAVDGTVPGHLGEGGRLWIIAEHTDGVRRLWVAGKVYGIGRDVTCYWVFRAE